MSELVFERGLYATLAAALIVPELTTFVLFLFVLLSVVTFFARQAWSHVWIKHRSQVFTSPPIERVALRVVSADSSRSS
ncbi:MAG TPA: hypothetical protein VFG04_27110 [Planctomycetaceae bacterium]|jgi:hypothetical protein|nr:hypothetical protein [Planctomycetaceae bacterium]